MKKDTIFINGRVLQEVKQNRMAVQALHCRLTSIWCYINSYVGTNWVHWEMLAIRYLF